MGKGTLHKALRDRHPDLYLSTSVTTRAPRPGEVDGRDYYFVARPRFEQMVANGELLEWAEFAGNCYGTPRLPVEQNVRQGNWVLLEIEVEGARQIRQTFPDAVLAFVLPPSLEELERRLRSRSQDSDEAIARRLERARTELEAAGEFDIQIVNDRLEEAIDRLETALFHPPVTTAH